MAPQNKSAKQTPQKNEQQEGRTSPVLPLNINMQFIRDLSFEVPHGAAIFPALQRRPDVSVSIDVNAGTLSQKNGIYEVAISLRVEAKTAAEEQGEKKEKEEPRTVFLCDLIYCSVVTLNNPPQELIEPLLFVEVPRLIFPYARNIISDATRDGGFPPVVLQPVDFVAFWQTRRAQRAQQQQQQQGKQAQKPAEGQQKPNANISDKAGHA